MKGGVTYTDSETRKKKATTLDALREYLRRTPRADIDIAVLREMVESA